MTQHAHRPVVIPAPAGDDRPLIHIHTVLLTPEGTLSSRESDIARVYAWIDGHPQRITRDGRIVPVPTSQRFHRTYDDYKPYLQQWVRLIDDTYTPDPTTERADVDELVTAYSKWAADHEAYIAGKV